MSWNFVSASEKKRIGKLQGAKDDGIFFMPYNEFLDAFDGVQICQYHDNFVYKGIDLKPKSKAQIV